MGRLAPTLEPLIVRDNAPAIAHLHDRAHPGPDIRGLCGAQLIGVPAPMTAPSCETCARLWRAAS